MLFYNLVSFLPRFFRAVQQRLIERNVAGREWTEMGAAKSACAFFSTGKRGNAIRTETAALTTGRLAVQLNARTDEATNKTIEFRTRRRTDDQKFQVAVAANSFSCPPNLSFRCSALPDCFLLRRSFFSADFILCFSARAL